MSYRPPGSASSAATYIPGPNYAASGDDDAGFSSSVGSYFHHPQSRSSSSLPSPVLSPPNASLPHSRQTSHTSLSKLSTSTSGANLNVNKPYSRSPPATTSFASRVHQARPSLGHVADSLSQVESPGSSTRGTADSDRTRNGRQGSIGSTGARFELGPLTMTSGSSTVSNVASPTNATSPFSPLPFSDASVMGGSEDDVASSMAAEDPLATQMWKFFVRQKNMPHSARMENLSWRMGGMRLHQAVAQTRPIPERRFDEEEPARREEAVVDMATRGSKPVENVSAVQEEEGRGRERMIKSAGGTPESAASPHNAEDDDLYAPSFSLLWKFIDRKAGVSDEMEWRAKSRSRSRVGRLMSMDWRAVSRSRSRAPISRSSLPSQPILSTDAAAEASFATAVGELDPNSVAALFTRLPRAPLKAAQSSESSAAAPPAVAPPTTRPDGEPYYNQFDENFFEQTLNSLLNNGTGGEAQGDEGITPQPPVWPASLPSDRLLSTGPPGQAQQPSDQANLDRSALAWRHWHAMHDEAVHARNAGSIPGLMDERSLKENQHAEFGFLPRLVRKTSFDERSGRPVSLSEQARQVQAEVDPRSRRPSPARPPITVRFFSTRFF
jgi:GATA-binding protein